MLKRKIMFVGFFAFWLLATVYIGIAALPYDPWSDVKPDGVIDIQDLTLVSLGLWTQGTPINHAAVQFEGNTSVPAAAFVPFDSDYSVRIGYSLWNDEAFPIYFYGSVQLPHGATITKYTIYWYDNGSETIGGDLYRYGHGTGIDWMAYTPSIGDLGYGFSEDTTISYATVDNNKYTYYLRVRIPDSASHDDYQFTHALIEFKY